MARKTKTVTIHLEGRDQNKVFFMTEMSARASEAWATRALLALARSGVEVPDNVMDLGLAGIAVLGVRALGGLDYDKAQPLLDEMLACVEAVPNPSNPMVRRPLVDDDVEEIATLLFLRQEVINLHVDFFTSGKLRKQAAAEVLTPPSA